MSVFSLGIRFGRKNRSFYNEQKALWVDTQGETLWTHTYNRYNTVGRLRYYQTSHSLNVCTLRVSARIRWWEPRWASNHAPLQKKPSHLCQWQVEQQQATRPSSCSPFMQQLAWWAGHVLGYRKLISTVSIIRNTVQSWYFKAHTAC